MAKKDEKVLGHDPFANGDNLLAEEESKARTSALVEVPPAEDSRSLSEETTAYSESLEGDTMVEEIAAPNLPKDGSTDPSRAGVEAAKTADEESLPADEDVSVTLEELIATIDQEVERTFGHGPMAGIGEVAGQVGTEKQYIIFFLADTEYGAGIEHVSEVGQIPEVTPVPNLPHWLQGVANLRGNIISVVDLRSFLGLERAPYGKDTRLLVAQAEELTIGLVVDRVVGIRYLPVAEISQPAGLIEDQVAPCLRGVYEHDGHLLAVLNLDRLLLSPAMRQFEPV